MEIYAVRIYDLSEERLTELCSLIDLEKKNKIERFVNKKDKIRAIIGETLIRMIVIENLKLSNKYISFDKNQYGKPYLKDYPNINFNISHSGDYVLCAVDDRPVGVDVEEVKDIKCEEIAKSFFTTKESEYIISQDLKIQLDKFYEIWTLKESYIKCCGQGLSIPLNSFYLDLDKRENIKAVSNDKYTEHTFKVFNIELGYKVAVCSLNKEISNNIVRLDQNYLINKFTELCLK